MPITTEPQSKVNGKNKHASTTNLRDEKKKTGFEIMVVPVVIEALRVARRKRLVMC